MEDSTKILGILNVSVSWRMQDCKEIICVLNFTVVWGMEDSKDILDTLNVTVPCRIEDIKDILGMNVHTSEELKRLLDRPSLDRPFLLHRFDEDG